MDAIKIIKKHGTPGGLPVVTVYVDADAPGEAAPQDKMYLHHIQTSASGAAEPAFLDFISFSATALTAADVAKILYDLGLDSSGRVWAAANVIVGLTGVISTVTGFYSPNGTALKGSKVSFSPTITDNTLAYSSASLIVDYTTVVDRVLEIK